MSKTAKIICAVVGGIGVVAAGVVVAHKFIKGSDAKNYISTDNGLDALIPSEPNTSIGE